MSQADHGRQTTPGPAWSTRAELLAERARRLQELERGRYGWRRDVRPAVAMLVAFLSSGLALVSLEDDPSTGTVAVWWAVSAVAAAWLLLVLVRRARASRSWDAELRYWRGIDRTRAARALPGGDVPDELLTMFDARDRPDLERVSSDAGLDAMQRIRDTRLLWPAFRATPPLMFGLVWMLGGLLSVDGVAAGAPPAVVGALLMVAGATAMWATFVEGFRRQQDVNGGYDRQLYSARASALGGPTPDSIRPVPLAARLTVGLIALVLVVPLAVRLALASPIVLAAVAVTVLIAAIATVPPLLRRRALHVVPQTTGGDTVLDPPRCRVTVDLVDDAIVIAAVAADVPSATIPLADVLTMIDLHLGYPFAPPAVGIVTEAENVVIAGAGVRELPAIAAAKATTLST